MGTGPPLRIQLHTRCTYVHGSRVILDMPCGPNAPVRSASYSAGLQRSYVLAVV